MSRSYRGIRPKAKFVYSRAEVENLFGISKNTLTNWKKLGLRPVDDLSPTIFGGAELIRFIESIRPKPGQKKRLGEFECYTCKIRVFPDANTIIVEREVGGFGWARCQCPHCHRTCQKLMSATDCDRLEDCLNHNTSLYCSDEEGVEIVADIGKIAADCDAYYNARNERIVFEYLVRIRGNRPRTVEAIINAVRDLEAFVRKPFNSFTVDDVGRYRDHLIDACLHRSERAMSRSTVRHRESTVGKFLEWLVIHPHCTNIDKRLPLYIVISRGTTGTALEPQPKPFMSVDEIARLVKCAPHLSLAQRRDRAIIVLTIAFGTRSNTTASVLLRDLNLTELTLSMDSSHVRTKASKSYVAAAFPDGVPFMQILKDWKCELESLGALPDDALFPPDQHLVRNKLIRDKSGALIKPWKTDASIRQAFARLCIAAGLPYFNPHSVKHFLKSRKEFHCKTNEERKAYSMNLGHKTEQVTETNYAKMTNIQQTQVMARLNDQDRLPEKDTELLLAYHEHRLTQGSADFNRAKVLSIQRLQRGCDTCST